MIKYTRKQKGFKMPRLIHGDCLIELKKLPNNFVDSIVTDPPYGISFMNKKWDYDIPSVEIWRECLRVVKPGGHILVACGTKTQHRMAVSIEEAGFHIRDVITWLYGQGFPKSQNVALAIDKQLGVESDVIGDNPNKRAAHKKGSAGFDKNLGGTSLEKMSIKAATSPQAKKWQGFGTALKPACEFWTLCRKPLSESTIGKNVLRWGTGAINIDRCRVSPATDYVRSAANAEGTISISAFNELSGVGRFPTNLLLDDDSAQALDAQIEGSSRFFYVAKANAADRGTGNTHPTCKPTTLMAYLCRLITPPNGVVLDPFMGSGSTGIGACREGFEFIGIEKELDYLQIARSRLNITQTCKDY